MFPNHGTVPFCLAEFVSTTKMCGHRISKGLKPGVPQERDPPTSNESDIQQHKKETPPAFGGLAFDQTCKDPILQILLQISAAAALTAILFAGPEPLC